MKKTVAMMVFVVLTALSLCACGGKETTQEKAASKETKEETVIKTETMKESETEKITEKETELITEAKTETQTEEPETEEIPFNSAEIIEVGYETSYAHIDSEMIRLGNDEEATVTIKATPAGLNEKDILFFCEKDLIDYDVEIKSDESGNTTEFIYTVYGTNPGTTDLYICTAYDDYVMGDEAPYYDLPLAVFDTERGQVVYVTETGEKYHLSADCAGEGAIKTTLSDAEACEKEPCGKCAQ